MKILPTLRDAGRWFVSVPPLRAAMNDWSGLVGMTFVLMAIPVSFVLLGVVIHGR